jgi:putative PIN family toxin of toxin-antitoxin system
MRLVLDTNVMIAAMRSRKGASARLVLAGLSGGVTLVCSVPLFVEYEAVMTRAEHLVAAKVTRERIVAVLDDLARAINPATRDISWRPQLTDADDEMVLEAAVNGGADALVTFETTTFAEAGRRFGIEVLTPAAACVKLRL